MVRKCGRSSVARHKRHRLLHGSTCRMDSNATEARSTLRHVGEQLLILANEGQKGNNFFLSFLFLNRD